MRRKVIDLTTVPLDINIFDMGEGSVRLEFYSLAGDLTKQICHKDRMMPIITQIKKDRHNFWCLKDGKIIYPFRR